MEQVLLLAKNARSLSSVIDLVSNALALPELFVYGELLQLDYVQQVKDDPAFQQWFAALELYAYGTWNDWIREPERFPELTPKQQLKLKQLTAVSLAQSKQVLLYDELKAALGFEETRDLEDFLIESCVYCRILKGKLDQAGKQFLVHDSINRDVRIEEFTHIKSKLSTWFQSSEKILDEIVERMVFTTKVVEKNETHRKELAEKTASGMREIKDMDGMRMDASDGLNDEIYVSLAEDRDPKSRRGEGSSRP